MEKMFYYIFIQITVHEFNVKGYRRSNNVETFTRPSDQSNRQQGSSVLRVFGSSKKY